MVAEAAVFGGGCFWCTEAVFKMLRGVESVEPGYAGGADASPSYHRVSSGRTGHAEVVRVQFDPQQVSYRDLLTVFFATHDPTSPNRQGADVGTQYRSLILYASPEQRAEAEAYIAELNASAGLGKPVVTELQPLGQFYPAEAEHRDFYAANPGSMYCRVVIDPKLEKVRQRFKQLLRNGANPADSPS